MGILLERCRSGLLPLIHLVRVAIGELSVAVEAAHPEVDVSIRLVGVTALDQGLDQGDDLRDGLRGERLGVGTAEAEGVRVGDVRTGHLLRVLGRGLTRFPGRVVDLVVDVGDVDDELRLETLVLEEAAQKREDDERPGVADVDAPVDGRTAGVDTDLTRLAGLESADLAAQRVLDAHVRHVADAIDAQKHAYSASKGSREDRWDGNNRSGAID